MPAAPCPTEIAVERLRAARQWLEGRGWRTRADWAAADPVPLYHATGVPRLMTAGQLISFAEMHGWDGR